MLPRAGRALQGALGNGARVSRRLCEPPIRLQNRARRRPQRAGFRDHRLRANIKLSIPGHGHNPAFKCSVLFRTVLQYARMCQVASPFIPAGGRIIAPRVRQCTSFARRHPYAHSRPARALYPALHDHLFIHLPPSHRVHLPVQLGRKASSVPTTPLCPPTHGSHTLPILRPLPIPMLFLRACDMSRARGPFRGCRDSARGTQASGNMAWCARISVFSGTHSAAEYAPASTG